jgi:hypothetical protein
LHFIFAECYLFSWTFLPRWFHNLMYHVPNQLLFPARLSESYPRITIRIKLIGRFLNVFHLRRIRS